MAPPKKPYKHAAAAWREQQAASELEEALLSGLPARESVPVHIQAAIAKALHSLTRAFTQALTTAEPTAETATATAAAQPTHLSPTLHTLATLSAAPILHQALHSIPPEAYPWAATLTHTYLLLACPHAQSLLLPPCTPLSLLSHRNSHTHTHTLSNSAIPSLLSPSLSTASHVSVVDDLATCSQWRVPLWAYTRLVTQLQLEAHLMEAVLLWFASPSHALSPHHPTNTDQSPPQTASARNSTTNSSSSLTSTTAHTQQHSTLAFMQAALTEWPQLAVGVLAELCPPLTVDSSQSVQPTAPQLAFCTDGAASPHAMHLSLPLLCSALHALKQADNLHDDETITSCEAADEQGTCVRHLRCLLSICLAARWALHHLPSTQSRPSLPSASVSDLLQLALAQLEAKLPAWQCCFGRGSDTDTGSEQQQQQQHLLHPSHSPHSQQQQQQQNQQQQQICLKELRAQLACLNEELQHSPQRASNGSLAAHFEHLCSSQTSQAQQQQQSFNAVTASAPHSASLPALPLIDGNACGNGCMAWLPIFGRVNEGCGSGGLHCWAMAQGGSIDSKGVSLSAVHAAPLSVSMAGKGEDGDSMPEMSAAGGEDVQHGGKQLGDKKGRRAQKEQVQSEHAGAKQQQPQQEQKQQQQQQQKQQQEQERAQRGDDWQGLFCLPLPIQSVCGMPPHLLCAMEAVAAKQRAAQAALATPSALNNTSGTHAQGEEGKKAGLSGAGTASLLAALSGASNAHSAQVECAAVSSDAVGVGESTDQATPASAPSTQQPLQEPLQSQASTAPIPSTNTSQPLPLSPLSLCLKSVWQQHTGGLLCALLTPGMPCSFSSLQQQSVSDAAASDCYGPLRVSLALLELSAHVHACAGQWGVGSVGGKAAGTKGMNEAAGKEDSLCDEKGGVVLSLLLNMAVSSVGRVSAPVQQQALQFAAREGARYGRLMSYITHSSCLVSSAQRALVACCNRMVAHNRLASGVALGAVQEAQLEADTAQELLPPAMLLPQLLVQRLVLDAVRHPGQLPLLLRLLGGALRLAAVLPPPGSVLSTTSAAQEPHPLSTLLAVLREVLGVSAVASGTLASAQLPQQQQGQQQTQQQLQQQQQSQQPPQKQQAQIRGPSEQRAFLSLLSGLLREQEGRAGGDAPAGLVSRLQLVELMALPALQQACGHLEDQARLSLTVLSHLLKASSNTTSQIAKQEATQRVCSDLLLEEEECWQRGAHRAATTSSATLSRSLNQPLTASFPSSSTVAGLVISLSCMLQALRQNFCQQGTLDATSIELATSLLSALVASLSSLAATLQSQQQQQQHRQKLPWVPPFLRALSQISEGACGGDTCITDRSVLLCLVPLVEAGSALGTMPVSLPEDAAGAPALSRLLVPPSLWRPAASQGATQRMQTAQQQVSEALSFAACSEHHASLLGACVLEGLQEQAEDELAEAQEAASVDQGSNGLHAHTTQSALSELQQLLHSAQASSTATGVNSTARGTSMSSTADKPRPPHPHSASLVAARTMQRVLARQPPTTLRTGLVSGTAELLPLWSSSQAARGIRLALPLLLRAYGVEREGGGCCEEVGGWARECVAEFGADKVSTSKAGEGCDEKSGCVANILLQHLLHSSVEAGHGQLSCQTAGYVVHLLSGAVLQAVSATASESGATAGGLDSSVSSSSRRGVDSLKSTQAVADRCAQHVLAAVQRWLTPPSDAHVKQPAAEMHSGEVQQWALACVCLRELLSCAVALQRGGSGRVQGVEAAPLQVALLQAARVVLTPPLCAVFELKEEAEQQCSVEGIATVMGCSYAEVLQAVREVLCAYGEEAAGVRSLALAAVEMADEFLISQGIRQASDAVEHVLLG